MPQTIIVRRTWRCSYCDAEWDAAILDAQTCPYCNRGLVREETNPNRCGTLTVIGVENIEAEIAETTPEQRFRWRENERAKRGRAPLTPAELARTGPAEIAAYRADRLLDITHAIAEARKLEYTP